MILADLLNKIQPHVIGWIYNMISTGWISDSDTWVYVSATQLKIVGKDVRSRFPVGTKLRLTQGTVKYFYAIAAAMSGSDTLITLTGGSDYALANAAITSPAYSYAARPQGFPSLFSYSPIAVGLTSPIYAEQTGKFIINGNIVTCWGRLDITSWSGQSGTLLWTMPAPISGVGGASIGSASYYRLGSDPQQGPKIIYPGTGDQVRMLNNEGSGAVSWNTSSRVLIIWSASYPI